MVFKSNHILQQMKFLKILVILILIIFSFGEILRFDIGNNVVIKPLDFVVGLTGMWWIIFQIKSSKFKVKNLKKNKLNIKFNLSHSGQFAIFAFNLDSDIGVDIEAIVENPKQRELVHRFFSKKEQEDLNSLPENQKTLAFFKCWTQKEAFLKATGKGFSLSLKDFDVDVFPNHEASFTNIRHKDFSIQNWHLHTLKPSIECIGSLCLKGEPKKLRCWRWD